MAPWAWKCTILGPNLLKTSIGFPVLVSSSIALLNFDHSDSKRISGKFSKWQFVLQWHKLHQIQSCLNHWMQSVQKMERSHLWFLAVKESYRQSYGLKTSCTATLKESVCHCLRTPSPGYRCLLSILGENHHENEVNKYVLLLRVGNTMH